MQLPRINQPVKPTAGELRFNTVTDQMEGYDGYGWRPVTNTLKYRLEISSGTVYGNNYYTVEPINAAREKSEMMAWMIRTFGHPGASTPGGGGITDIRWYTSDGKFWFLNKKDLDWFVLRWSS